MMRRTILALAICAAAPAVSIAWETPRLDVEKHCGGQGAAVYERCMAREQHWYDETFRDERFRVRVTEEVLAFCLKNALLPNSYEHLADCIIDETEARERPKPQFRF